jgi:hypothetical protein
LALWLRPSRAQHSWRVRKIRPQGERHAHCI